MSLSIGSAHPELDWDAEATSTAPPEIALPTSAVRRTSFRLDVAVSRSGAAGAGALPDGLGATLEPVSPLRVPAG